MKNVIENFLTHLTQDWTIYDIYKESSIVAFFNQDNVQKSEWMLRVTQDDENNSFIVELFDNTSSINNLGSWWLEIPQALIKEFLQEKIKINGIKGTIQLRDNVYFAELYWKKLKEAIDECESGKLKAYTLNTLLEFEVPHKEHLEVGKKLKI